MSPSPRTSHVLLTPVVSCLLVSMLTLWGRQALCIGGSSRPQVPPGDPPESIVPAGKGVRRNTENRGVRCRATRDGHVEPRCLIFLDPSWCQGLHGCLATACNPGASLACRCSSDRAVPAAAVCCHSRSLKTHVSLGMGPRRRSTAHATHGLHMCLCCTLSFAIQESRPDASGSSDSPSPSFHASYRLTANLHSAPRATPPPSPSPWLVAGFTATLSLFVSILTR